MDVVVLGGHGKVGLRLLELLAERGDTARGVIRKPEQATDLEAVGAQAIVCDIEEQKLGDSIAGADAVVFAAGAGPGSGTVRKRTVDYGGAVKLIEAAKQNGIPRYVMVSAMGVNNPDGWSDQMRPYYKAKAEADEAVVRSRLDYTIARPGGLTDEEGTGRVAIAQSLDRSGSVPRDDVALVLAEVLVADNTIGKSFDLLDGVTEVAEAVRAL